MINPNWARWIFASVSKHFDTNKNGIDLYIEGQHRNATQVKDSLELRVDGPYYTEESHNYWRIYIEVSLLVQSMQDDKDFHRTHRICGQVAAAFTTIPIFKFGDGPSDNANVQIGCLEVITGGSRERIQTNHFGLLAPDVKLMQSTVEAHYEVHLSN